MKRRVVVTGMGVVSPIGCALDEFRRNLLAGVSGVGPITLFDPAALRTRIAAEVKLTRRASEVPFDEVGAASRAAPAPSPARLAGPAENRSVSGNAQAFPAGLRDRKITFALEAAHRAMEDAAVNGSRPGGEAGGEDAALSLGIGLELFSMEDLVTFRRPGFRLPESLAERMTFLQTPSDLCLHLISHGYGLTRPPLTHTSACASGTDAIGMAYRLIASGRRSWMLAGGSDSMINPLGVGGFCKIGATSAANDAPQKASRPFDRGRDGFVLGEGAAMLVLEPLDAARARGAKVHAEIVGYGNSFDAHGISEPHPEGRGAYQAMSRALEDAGLSPAAIDCVNAHGSSTPKNDTMETLALKRLLGDRAAQVPICSTKSMIGHLIAAAGAVEAVAAIVTMQAGQVHPTINLDDPDPACDLDYVPHRARPREQQYVLSNSFGFGGQNASIVIRNGSSVDA